MELKIDQLRFLARALTTAAMQYRREACSDELESPQHNAHIRELFERAAIAERIRDRITGEILRRARP